MRARLLAEAIGTFGLVLVGPGAVVVNDVSGGALGHVGISMCFGLVVMSMIYAFGDVSGAHINPAVTTGFWLSGRFPANRVAPYIGAQLIGCLAAGGLLHVMFPTHATLGSTLPSGTVLQSAIMEFVLTWLLMLVILSVSTGAKEKGVMAGAAIGAYVLLAAMFGGPISGASMNPARSIGPAVASETWSHLWLYLVVPTAGALCAVPFCKWINPEGCCEPDEC